MNKWKGYEVGDEIVINGDWNWHGIWEGIPATITSLNSNGYLTATLQVSVKGWTLNKVAIDDPKYIAHATPLELLIIQKLGEDYQ